MSKITKEQYEFALARIEELLPMVDDNTSANDRNAIELTMMSDVVIDYEKEHFPIAKPTSPVDTPFARRKANEPEAVGCQDRCQHFSHQRLHFRAGRTNTKDSSSAMHHTGHLPRSYVGLLSIKRNKRSNLNATSLVFNTHPR